MCSRQIRISAESYELARGRIASNGSYKWASWLTHEFSYRRYWSTTKTPDALVLSSGKRALSCGSFQVVVLSDCGHNTTGNFIAWRPGPAAASDLEKLGPIRALSVRLSQTKNRPVELTIFTAVVLRQLFIQNPQELGDGYSLWQNPLSSDQMLFVCLTQSIRRVENIGVTPTMIDGRAVWQLPYDQLRVAYV